MASGDSLFAGSPLGAMQWDTANAYHATFEGRPALAFPADLDRFAYWTSVMPGQYGGGGLTLDVHWWCEAGTGDVRWAVAVEKLESGVDSATTTDFGAVATVTATTLSGGAGIVKTTITLSSDDSITSGMLFRIRLHRDGNAAQDTLASLVYVGGVELRET